MCGICGIAFSDPAQPAHRSMLRPMCDAMRHRGPDDEGYFADAGVGLGMRRLSVIDVAGGHQPISNEDGSVQVVLNGEIYNFQELKEQLAARGHRFRTSSDTEVIAHLYEEKGDACVEQLRGMFAFALWDARRNRLLAARDRVGKKPFHYAALPDRLLFASEIKSLLVHPEVPREVDLQALDQFLTLEYVPGQRTMFRAVKRLPPGCLLTWEQGFLRIRRYWNPEVTPIQGKSLDCWARLLHHELREAVRLRLISDVPLGVLLSGGIDSSTIVALMREVTSGTIRTFSIGFDDRSYNELGYARLIARRFGAEHEEMTVRPDAASLARQLVRQFDEPFADVSAIPTFLVSQMARRRVTVALGGDGGDELFGGYETYLAERAAAVWMLLPAPLRGLAQRGADRLKPTSKKKGAVNRIKRFLEGMRQPAGLGHARWMIFLSPAEKAGLYAPELLNQVGLHNGYEPLLRAAEAHRDLDPLERAMAVDLETYLPGDILTKVDRMSMAASLEVRAPLLDHRVVELALRIPASMKIRGAQTKAVLRRMMRDKLPREVLRKRKEGFSIPMKNWLRQELRPMMLDYLSEARLRRRGYVRPEAVRALLQEHLHGDENHAHRLWPLMMLEMWHEQYADRTAEVAQAV